MAAYGKYRSDLNACHRNMMDTHSLLDVNSQHPDGSNAEMRIPPTVVEAQQIDCIVTLAGAPIRMNHSGRPEVEVATGNCWLITA